MKFKIGELVASEFWEDGANSNVAAVGIIVDVGKGGWYTVHWSNGENGIHHTSQIEVYKEVLNARVV